MSKQQRVRALTLALIVAAFVAAAGRQAGWELPEWRGLNDPQRQPEPRDVIYRMLDAAREGDVEEYLACYSGPMRQTLQRTRDEMTAEAFGRYLMAQNREIKGIAISEPVAVSDGQARVRVEYVYQDRNEAQQYHLQNRDGAWTIVEVNEAQRVETPIPYGTPVY